MDIYSSAVEYASAFPVLQSWPNGQSLLRYAASLKPRDWQLPVRACEAVGGSAEQAIPAAAVIACAQVSIILVDDMLDEDPRGEYHKIGNGQAANFASAFQAAGLDACLLSEAPLMPKLCAVSALNRMMITTAHGQHLDVQNPTSETDYWSVVDNKSAPFYGTALYLGALFGGATDNVANALEKFGHLYGAMIQIHNDLNDSMAEPASPDWVQHRSSLLILYASLVNHVDRSRFLALYQDVSRPEALREAQEILIRCGAISYCVDQLLHRHKSAQEILGSISLFRKEILEALVEDLVAPVRRLFNSLGRSSLNNQAEIQRVLEQRLLFQYNNCSNFCSIPNIGTCVGIPLLKMCFPGVNNLVGPPLCILIVLFN